MIIYCHMPVCYYGLISTSMNEICILVFMIDVVNSKQGISLLGGQFEGI